MKCGETRHCMLFTPILTTIGNTKTGKLQKKRQTIPSWLDFPPPRPMNLISTIAGFQNCAKLLSSALNVLVCQCGLLAFGTEIQPHGFLHSIVSLNFQVCGSSHIDIS